MKLFFLTHHKCASGWFNSINFDLFKAYGRVMYVLNKNEATYKSLNDFYDKNNAGFLAFNNADPDYIEFQDNFRAVHVIRDPRDIIISGYFSHKKVHPVYDTRQGRALEKHRKKLNNLNVEKGLIEEISYQKKWYLQKLEKMSNYSSDKLLRIKLENLSGNYIFTYRKILSFYGLDIVENSYKNKILLPYYRIAVPLAKRGIIKNPMPRNSINNSTFVKCLKEKSWEKMTGGRKKGDENQERHYRKGIHGDWKNYFTRNVYSVFRREFPDIIERLKYSES